MVDIETLEAPESGPKGSEAAAILLMLLSEDEAANVLSRLEPEEVQSLGGAMFEVADVSEEQVSTVLDLFVSRARACTTIGFDADTQIRGMMERALGNDKAAKVLARITPPARMATLEALKWLDAGTIANVVEHEHPQIAALVLAHLDSGIAGDVLQLLPEQQQAETIYRIARLGPVTSDALDDIERLMLRQVGKISTGIVSKRGGVAEAAKIVNSTRTSTEQRIIRSLTKMDKELAQTIRDEMFVFDNLMDIDEKSLGALFRSVDNEVMVVALKGADETLKNRIFGCMSARAVSSIQDEMEERGPMRLAEVQDAQKVILAQARQMADAGTIMLGGKGDDYV
jgi:flagellar motor switch protein FliG